MSLYEYDIALSYAEEDSSYADSLAIALLSKKIRVFYYKFEEYNFWGKDLIKYLREVFSEKAQYCIILISKHYGSKKWTKHERESAQERALRQETEYILPIRLDDTPLPGLPETIAYIRFHDHTIDELALLCAKKLGYPPGDIIPVQTTTPPPPEKPADVDPKQDPRFLRHAKLTAKLFPSEKEYGYFALHSFAPSGIETSNEQLRSTFLDLNRSYSGFLSLSSLPDVHSDGYTRRYEIHKKSSAPITTEATTCYFDGYIVTEGYIDFLCEGDEGFNPNWFIYEIQRHLQLTKEVFEPLTTEATCAVVFRNLEKFKWEIYKRTQVCETKSYAGYHTDIVFPIHLSEINGRDQWNIKIEAAESAILGIARMFGMDRLPQPYWNDAGELYYAYGIPSR
ncbi:hypothetical protein ES702_05790 [subsurface metagenome]